MSALGKVSIGRKAPYFRCEAVIKGAIEEVSLSTYIKPSIKPGAQNHDAPWLIIIFIPAAFSFLCPTEVLAFQNCLDEFIGRNCNIVFVSVDTKHSLWHWQNVPRQYGGLGPIDIPLLSDSNHRLAKDYGVLIEEEGVSLRGMFIIDGEGLVQQITLNNLSVGRSVLEALRLLEAFQAVARHGVLCPIDWKSSKNNSEATDTISNTLAESYEERLANLQKEFGDIQVTDLDAKQKSNDSPSDVTTNSGAKSNNDDLKKGTPAVTVRPTRSHSNSEPPSIRQVSCSRPKHPSPLNSHHNDYLAHTTSQSLSIPSESSPSPRLSSAPQSANTTPTSTPTTNQSPTTKLQTMARHARGMHPQLMDAHYMNSLFYQSAPSIFRPFIRHKSTASASASASDTNSQSGPSTAPSTAPPTPLLRSRSKSSSSLPPRLTIHNTHESMSGDQVLLEFADPTDTSPSPSLARHVPATTRTTKSPRARARARAASYANSTSTRWSSASPEQASGHVRTPSASQTMMQTAFDAIKKMGSGLGSPRRNGCGSETGTGTDEDGKGSGYFDVVVEGEAT